MKIFSDNIQDLRALYISNLRKALDMEQSITKALPLMMEKATDTQLRQGFQSHLQETELHARRVEELLVSLTGDNSTLTCPAIKGLVTDANDSMKDAADPTIMDVTLIACAQMVEHHEIAVYGTLRTWALLLGETSQAATLDGILHDEKHADQLLSTISDRVNSEASTSTSGTFASVS